MGHDSLGERTFLFRSSDHDTIPCSYQPIRHETKQMRSPPAQGTASSGMETDIRSRLKSVRGLDGTKGYDIMHVQRELQASVLCRNAEMLQQCHMSVGLG